MLLPHALPCSLPLPPAKLPVGYYRDVFINALSSFYDSHSPPFLSPPPLLLFSASISCPARCLFFFFFLHFLFLLSIFGSYYPLFSISISISVLFFALSVHFIIIRTVFSISCHHHSNLPHSSRWDRSASMTHFDLLCSSRSLSLQRSPRSHLN